jgi:hypothetical protein
VLSPGRHKTRHTHHIPLTLLEGGRMPRIPIARGWRSPTRVGKTRLFRFTRGMDNACLPLEVRSSVKTSRNSERIDPVALLMWGERYLSCSGTRSTAADRSGRPSNGFAFRLCVGKENFSLFPPLLVASVLFACAEPTFFAILCHEAEFRLCSKGGTCSFAVGDSFRVRRVALDCIPGSARKHSEGGAWTTQPTGSRKAEGNIACCGTRR